MLWSFLETLISKICPSWGDTKESAFSEDDYAFNEIDDGKVTLTFVGGGNPKELELVEETAGGIKVSVETSDILVSQGTTTINGDVVNTITLKG